LKLRHSSPLFSGDRSTDCALAEEEQSPQLKD